MAKPGQQSAAIVETVDIFPTLCDLTALDTPAFTSRSSLLPQIQAPQSAGHTAIAYNGKAQSIRTETYRLILHKNGTTELYDHRQPHAETPSGKWADLALLEPVRDYGARHASTLLVFDALEDAMAQIEAKRAGADIPDRADANHG